MKTTATRAPEARPVTSRQPARMPPDHAVAVQGALSGLPRFLRAAAMRPPAPSVSGPGDALELEADRVADHALSTPESPAPERQALPAGAHPASTDLAGGEPLSDSIRSYFEPRLGHDLGRVHVHRGEHRFPELPRF